MAFAIRRMTRDDLALAVAWAAAEGWNPGQLDAGPYYATDPEGFLVGELDGAVIGSISVVAYDDRFGFLGFYIVRPEHRGKGHGLALWQAGIAYLAGRNVGLDGVVAQQGNYRKSGFAPAFRSTAAVVRWAAPPGRACLMSYVPETEPRDEQVAPHVEERLMARRAEPWGSQGRGSGPGGRQRRCSTRR